MSKNNTIIIFAEDHFNPLGVIRSFGEAGIRPDVILISPRNPILVNYCRYSNKLYKAESIEQGYEILLKNYSEETVKPIVYATSDDVESYLDLHFDELKDKFFFFNAGEQGRITQMMEKEKIVEMARACGLQTPKTEEVNVGELPRTLSYPILTKAPISIINNWKSNVFICKDEHELREAYQHIACDKVILQEYIDKVDELNIEGFCINDGEAYFTLNNRFYRTTNKSYGNYLYIEKYHYPELEDSIRRLFKLTRYNGIFEMEFMIGADGRFYFLEINFRNSAWLYGYTACGQNLPLMWAKSVVAGEFVTEDEHISKLPFRCIDELTDFKWSVLSGQVGLLTWLHQCLTADAHFYFNKHDLKPYFMYLFNRLKRAICH